MHSGPHRCRCVELCDPWPAHGFILDAGLKELVPQNRTSLTKDMRPLQLHTNPKDCILLMTVRNYHMSIKSTCLCETELFLGVFIYRVSLISYFSL